MTYNWLTTNSRKFLERGYLVKGEIPETRMEDMARIAEQRLIKASSGAGLNFIGFADRFLGFLDKKFFSISSPIWSNFGRERGLPISCFGSYIPDDMSAILAKIGEVGTMTKVGGGTSGYFGDVRSRGSKISSGGESTGVHHQLTVFDSLTNYVSQGNVRRGAFAAYLPIDHDDVNEFLNIKAVGDHIQDINIGVCISDDWMQSMVDGDKGKRKLWGDVIKKKYESGYPYVIFTDTVNNNAPDVYKDKGMKIHASNLCTEIFLSSDKDESFVCDLSSINLEKWDEIVETDAIEHLVYFLDAVMSEFIEKTEGVKELAAARRFAVNQRALGVGVLGWHTLLQIKNIAFESMEAKGLTTNIFNTLQERTLIASEKLADACGEPPLMKGYGRRNSTLMAIAPTTSSAFILGQVSQGIEPYNSNYFTQDLAKGRFAFRNPQLKKLLEAKGKDTPEVWRDILKHGGSVQHVDFLSDHEKDVYKTFGEVSQREIIIQAAIRQPFIDQGQSLNLMIPPDTPPKDTSKLMIFAWEQKIKSLYYQRSANPAQELARNINKCASCEG